MEGWSLGAWIKRRRRALDLTQGELAARVGCSAELIAKIEGDARRPSKQVAALLAAHLELPPDERATFVCAARAELPVDRLPPAAGVPLPAFAGPPTVPAAPRHNLPAPPNALIGRERELDDLAARLRDGAARLLTLTGPGGSGKTRLALSAAWAAVGDPALHGGAWFVDLAPVSDPALVAPAIVRALGLIEQPDTPAEERLHAFLRGRRALLVLDNFEQVLDAAPLVAGLLAAAPALRVLATSRAPLHIRAEHIVTVPPLALPPAELGEPGAGDGVPASIAVAPAVQLFVARARAVRPDWVLTAANAADVAALCRRLDGLPLAIELAAAQARLFTPAEVLAKLGSGLDLDGGPRDAPTRQRTIRATIAWSYELLPPDARALFRRLGVFVGGFTREAAEAVYGVLSRENGDSPAQSPLSDLQAPAAQGLAALLDHGLVRRLEGADGAPPRFGMLEPVREFALEELAACGELEVARERHAAYFLALAEAAAPQIVGAEQLAWLNRLEQENDNLRAALAWSERAADGEFGLRLVTVLDEFWCLRGDHRECVAWVEGALEQAQACPPLLRARALYIAGRMAMWHDSIKGSQYLAESLRLYEEVGDTRGAAEVLNEQAWQVGVWGGSDRLSLASRSVALFRELDDRRGLGNALLTVSYWVADDGDYALAEQYLEEAAEHFAAASDLRGRSLTQEMRGNVARARGEYCRAAALYRENIAICRQLRDQARMPTALCNLGFAAQGQGDWEEMRASFAEGLAWNLPLADPYGIAICIRGIGGAAGMAGRPELAARLCGAGDALFEATGRAEDSLDRADYDRAVALIRAALGDEAFAAAYEAGRALTLEQAVAEALRAADAVLQ